MIVRSVYPLKSFASLKEAQTHVRKVNGGAGVHADSKLEIHWNKKAKKKVPLKGPSGAHGVFTQVQQQDDDVDESLQWVVVVVDSDMIPGGSTCAECEKVHFADDYLCPDCRESI
jgi:hypothetical protein